MRRKLDKGKSAGLQHLMIAAVHALHCYATMFHFNAIHVVANRLIDLSLKARGYEVFNLGVNTYLEEFFDACVETGADILLISSLNGEAEGWSREIKSLKSRYKGLDNLIMMIGGNLSVGAGDPQTIVPKYKKYGFDLVCHQIDLNTGLDMLQDFIAKRDNS